MSGEPLDVTVPQAPRKELGDPIQEPSTRGRLVKPVMAIVGLTGVLIMLGLVVHLGWRSVATSLSTLGLGGFAIFCVYTLGVFMLLGSAWFVIVPGLALRHLPAFIFGRLVREAGADTLPFSQLGGFVMGARAATLLGAPSSIAIASGIVDLGAEMVGQLLFTALGAAIIWKDAPARFPHRLMDPVLVSGLAVILIVAVLFIGSQRVGLRLLERFSARWPASFSAQLTAVQQTLQGLYRRLARLLLATVLHLAAWLAATGGVWLVLRLMGAPLPLSSVVALESLIYILRSAAFAIPGAVGVLEGGYVLLGPMFGLRPEIALSLSLTKRGRDFAVGLPAIIAWQLLEGGRLYGSRSGRTMSCRRT